MARVTLNRVSADTTISNTAAESTMYTYSVPANMGAIDGQRLVLSMLCTLLNNSGANRTYTMRLKFGATTVIADAMIAIPTSTALRSFEIIVEIANDGATNAQFCKMSVSVSAPLAVTTGLSGDYGTAPTEIGSVIMNTSALDQTVSQTLAVTIQADAATATQTITMRNALLEMAT